jgi:hypothetical protein
MQIAIKKITRAPPGNFIKLTQLTNKVCKQQQSKIVYTFTI